MKFRCTSAAVCLAGALSFLPSSQADTSSEVAKDSELRAMVDELARAKTLHLNNLDKPYFILYKADEPDHLSIRASLGGLISSSRSRNSQGTVEIRVGDANFDNTNCLFSGEPRSVPLPLDDNYAAVRTELWLASDGAYKLAVEQIARKRTALREVADPDKTPDLAPAKPVQIIEAVPSLKIDQGRWEQVISKLSGEFVKHPAVAFSSVDFRAISSTFRLVDSEGTIVRVPQELSEIGIRARALAPDGSYVWNHRFYTVLHASDLPGESQLAKDVEAVASETEALSKAPLADEFSGPVLFEQQAAAEMMAQVLTDALRIERKPLTPPELVSRAPHLMDSVWSSRIGAKVTPDWLSIFDNPAEAKYQGKPLAGQFDVDEEGVPAQRVTFVEKGTLKAFLTTRQPVRNINASTGHARLEGSFGAEKPVFGNVFVQAEHGVSEGQLKAQMLTMIKTRGLKYGVIVRRLDFPSTVNADELQNIFTQAQKGGITRTLTTALVAYRVYPDGARRVGSGAAI